MGMRGSGDQILPGHIGHNISHFFQATPAPSVLPNEHRGDAIGIALESVNLPAI